MKKERLKITPATHLIFIKDGEVLLSRRFNTGWKDGFYSVVGGHLEEKETVLQATIREGKEEAGIDLKDDDLKFTHVIHRLSDEQRVDFFFLVKNWEGEIRNMEPDKCDDLNWFDLDKLPDNMVPYVRQAIANIVKNIPYSQEGWG
ncbi:MAG TPA: NUDIX domain-containing protein [archaeon]|nr:NUDIX domain-containing protein [archaeon]